MQRILEFRDSARAVQAFQAGGREAAELGKSEHLMGVLTRLVQSQKGDIDAGYTRALVAQAAVAGDEESA